MVLVPSHHELGTKLVLDNVMLPPAWGNQTVPSTTNDAYCSQDLESALNSIFNNPNVGPFICRQLIQRLVTSNPSRDYVYRVAQVFNNDGTGVRGNLQAVVQAILLDYEARSPDMISQPTYGKQREPLLRVTAAGARVSAAGQRQRQLQPDHEPTDHHHHCQSASAGQWRHGLFIYSPTLQATPRRRRKAYTVTVTSPKTFTITAPQLMAGSYTARPTASSPAIFPVTAWRPAIRFT